MNTQRLFDAMVFKFSLDQKRLDDDLERMINSDNDMDYKLYEFEKILGKMVLLDASITKFKEILSNIENNNEQIKQEN